MKLNARAFGLAAGILWGLAIFVATIWSSAMGRGHTLAGFETYYFGYSISLGGAFVGLIWGFVNGFVFGFVVAWLYNMLDKAKPGAVGK